MPEKIMESASWNPVSVNIGPGSFQSIVTEFGSDDSVAIVTTRGTRERFLDRFLSCNDIAPNQIIDDCQKNPTFRHCKRLWESLRSDTTKIVAIGGGSVLDTAKFVSIRHKSGFEQLVKEIKSDGDLQTKHFVPLIMAPTTAGTGSEVTCWGTIWDDVNYLKYSISTPKLYAQRAYCDPKLTTSLSWETTVATALDALSHAFESIWNRHATEETCHYALEAIDLILDNLASLAKDPENLTRRENVMAGALYAGLAFSKTKTSVAHALSYYLTLRKSVSHGRACSFTLPHILAVYLDGESCNGLTQDHLLRLNRMYAELRVSTHPGEYGVPQAEFEAFFEAGTASDRIKNCTIDLDRLKAALKGTYMEPTSE